MPEEKDISEVIREYELRIKNLEDRYNLVIKSKDEQIEIYKDQIKFLREIIKQNADKPVKFVNENKVISGIETIKKNTNQSRNINIIDGTIYNSGAGAFNLGDISGTVANTINQLPSSPDPNQLGIKELLTKLQQAIETETELDDLDKSDALEEVQILAVASQNDDRNSKTIISSKSLRRLGRIVNELPDSSTLGNVSKEVLPAIAKLFDPTIKST